VRLSKIEREAAKSELVEIIYKDGTDAKMDLLQATKLLISGKIRQIIAPWKPGEMEQHLTGTVLEIERYINEQTGADKQKVVVS